METARRPLGHTRARPCLLTRSEDALPPSHPSPPHVPFHVHSERHLFRAKLAWGKWRCKKKKNHSHIDRRGSISSWSFFGGRRRLRIFLLSGCVCQSPKNRANRPEAGTTLQHQHLHFIVFHPPFFLLLGHRKKETQILVCTIIHFTLTSWTAQSAGPTQTWLPEKTMMKAGGAA